MSDRGWDWWKGVGLVIVALVAGNANEAWQALKSDQAKTATKQDVNELRADIATLRSDKQRLERAISDVQSLDERQRAITGLLCQLTQLHDKPCAFRNMAWVPGMPHPSPALTELLRVAYHKTPAIDIYLVKDDPGA